MAGMFDDLIPSDNGGMFDDLVPLSRAAPNAGESSFEDEGAPLSAGGLYQALNEGAIKGVAGLGGLPRLAVDLATPAANAILRGVGLPERQAGTSGLPTAQQLEQTIRRDYNQPGWIGPAPSARPYEPQNVFERGAETIGTFAPNALFPGGAVARTLSVAAPATAVTATKEMGGGELAQLAAALAGGYTGARMAAPRAAKAVGVTGEDVAKAADQGYKAVDQLGVTLKPSAVNRGISDIADDIAKSFDTDLAPKTLAVLNRDAAKYAPREADAMSALTGVQPAARAPVATSEIDSLRRRLGKVAGGADPTDAAAAKIAQRQLDDFMESLPQSEVVKGNAAKLAETLGEARGNYAASMRHEAFSNVIQRAEDQAAAAGSGANLQNSLRQQVKSFIRPDNRGASEASRNGFNDAEIAAMRAFVKGGGGNVSRAIGNLLGGGGGLGATASTGFGYMMAGPAAFAAPAVGAAVKSAGNRAALRRAENLLDLILARSPRAAKQQPVRTAPKSRNSAALLSALEAEQSQ